MSKKSNFGIHAFLSNNSTQQSRDSCLQIFVNLFTDESYVNDVIERFRLFVERILKIEHSSLYVIVLFQSLLDEPNPNSPANSLAAQLYQENKREYEKRVATVVEQSWLNFQESHIEDPR